MGTHTVYTTNTSFLMEVEEAFFVENRGIPPAGLWAGLAGLAVGSHGVVASGTVVRGVIAAGEEVEIIGLQQTTLRSIVNSAEIMPKFSDVEHMVRWRGYGHAAILLEGLEREQVRRGQVLATPGTIRAVRKFRAQIQFAPTELAAKQQTDIDAYRSNLHMRHTDVYATMWLPENKRHLQPGDRLELDVELNEPMAIEVGFRFTIGKFAGAGIVTSVME